jgi:short-subunit dehydrogenase
MSKFSCHTALITGASSGIGAAFARQLARPGCHLILSARRKERLQTLATELEQLGAQVEILTADLGTENGIQAVTQRILSETQLDLLINNAGFGIHGPFASVPLEEMAEMLRVHAEAPFRLTHAALQGMLARKKGAIINVSSIGAFRRSARSVMYSATKSFLTVFSESLHKSLKGTGVKIQSLCPGYTHTEFHQARATMVKMKTKNIPAFMWKDTSQVAAASLKALDRDQCLVIPGLIYKLAVFIGRLGFI